MSRKVKGFKITSSIKYLLFTSLAALFLSGVAQIMLRSFFYTETDYGISFSPYEASSLSIHGASSILFLVIFGALFPTHISRAYKAGVNMKTGILVLVFVFVLIITGYFLYYVANENLRTISSLTHSVLGVLLIPILFSHVIVGKLSNIKLKNKKHINVK